MQQSSEIDFWTSMGALNPLLEIKKKEEKYQYVNIEH